MQSTTTRRARSSAATAVVALACSVVFSALGASSAHAADPRGTSTAQLSVSASVVRRCNVATPALMVVGDETAHDGAAQLGESVALHCSKGDAAAIEVGPPAVQSALYAQLARDAYAASAGSARDAEPVVVTVLF